MSDKCDMIEKQVDLLREEVDDFKEAYIKNGKEIVRMAVILERVEKILEEEHLIDAEQEEHIRELTEKLPILNNLILQNTKMYKVFERGRWLTKLFWTAITSGSAITGYELLRKLFS